MGMIVAEEITGSKKFPEQLKQEWLYALKQPPAQEIGKSIDGINY
jgi:hypothetical protein